MAEMRIPTDSLPAELLKGLQNFVQQRMSLGVSTVATATAAAPPPPQPQSPPTSATMLSPVTTYATSLSSAQAFQQLLPVLSSATRTRPSTQITPPSPRSSPASSLLTSSSAPQSSSMLLSSASSSLSLSSSFSSSQYCSPSSKMSAADRLDRMPMTNSSHRDELDGNISDSIVHVIQPSETKTVTKGNVLDESDIVRVFPNNQEEIPAVQEHSEIVRIFAEDNAAESMSPDRGAVKVLSSSPSTSQSSPSFLNRSQSECVRIAENTPQKQKSTVVGNSRNVPSSMSHHPVSFMSTTPPKQPYDRHVYAPSPLRASSVHQSPRTSTQQMNDSDRNFGKPRQASSVSVATRMSLEFPTPPETPDDLDDEVFTYDASSVSVSKRQQIYRQSIESTPHRDNGRRNSDRSSDYCHQAIQRISPFSPAQRFSELRVGDRQHTRKRLSFEEEDIRSDYDNNPPLAVSNTLAPPTIIPASSSCSTTIPLDVVFQKCRSSNEHFSSRHYSQTVSSSSPAHLLRPSSCGPSPHKQMALSEPQNCQSTPTRDIQSHPVSRDYRNSTDSPVREVLGMLERNSRQKNLFQARPRLHSDGDDVTDGHTHWAVPSERASPVSEQPQPRRQTFSHGKRRRLDDDDEEEDTKPENPPLASQHSTATPLRPCEECMCSKFQESFLQMAERAYKSIRMDAVNADNIKFRQELAETNRVLSQSLDIMKNVKSLCGHGHHSRNSPSLCLAQSSSSAASSSSSSSLQPATSSQSLSSSSSTW